MLTAALAAAPWCAAYGCGARTGLDAPEIYGPHLLDCSEFRAFVQPATLDTFFVIDSSKSMNNETAQKQRKWDAVRASLAQYLSKPTTAGTFAGLSFFPIVNAGIAEDCRDASDCGEAGGGCVPLGHCNANESITCSIDADCPNPGDSCERFGLCKFKNIMCEPKKGECKDEGGNCVESGYCENFLRCDAGAYLITNPEPLPKAAADLLKRYDAQELSGYTPTLPAVTGGVQSCSAWMNAHPTHKAVVVLATDGLPDRCDEDFVGQGFNAGIANVRNSAAAGRADGVLTFVVGVFAPKDETYAAAALNQVAAAGGTGKAFIISTETDVAAQLSVALEEVRTSARCEFAIPQNTSVDLATVRVYVDEVSPPVSPVPNAAACTNAGGFYYDVPPTLTQHPRRLVLCPASCAKNVSHEIRVTCR
jgi:hypothetical protein